ncbi:hypothetical protein [Pelagicoccus sp. SDUM812003]|uniref:hypothetical protein n=1 Tax=Pelagicoccus sp. SDUM812003 TaxID=3041267 RepID=UPI00280DE34C|nr:hypothetical protein [Pelagicoccus sp. SDUM812003]MDQ8202595.1 hypothetical protein [Pelagicoccus sp. SDUM812003]
MSAAPKPDPSPSEALARRAFQVAAVFFVIAAGIGLYLRWYAISPQLGVTYRYLLHAHSHIAFLGWVFNAFIGIAIVLFLHPSRHRQIRQLFIVLQVANLGMLASFPFQGYAAASISFSTLHLAGSACFAILLWKDAPPGQAPSGFLKTSLVFMLLSSLGPLALGPMAAMDLRESPWYTFAIYFYLHFQYNGWFLFFLIAALLKAIENLSPSLPQNRLNKALWWLSIGTAGNVTLSALWIQVPIWVGAVALLSGCAQLIGLSTLLPSIIAAYRQADLQPLARALALLAMVCFVAKFFLQLFASLPGFISFSIDRFSAIGFLHLVFLGIVTPALILWALQNRWMKRGKASALGICGLLIGFAITEGALFLQALLTKLAQPPVAYLSELLIAGSVVLFAGTLFLTAALLRQRANV